MRTIALSLGFFALAVASSPSFALDQHTVSYEAQWTMSENNTATFTMHGFDSSLIQIDGGTLSKISVNLFYNSLLGSFQANPDLGIETDAILSLTTMNAANASGFIRESDPITGPSEAQGDGVLYTFKSADFGSEAFMAFLPSKATFGNFVTDTTLTFTLAGTIPAADNISADYFMTGSGTAVISYSYYGIPAPVPEPSSVGLAVAGVMMLFTRRRRNVQ